jgi:AcrR family transcriptional regulator
MTAREPLSRETIMDAALRLTETEGTTQLSLNRLGRALGVDATAVYRHYRDKDELMLALGDRLLDDAVAKMRPRKTWDATLENIAARLREVCLARPALAQQIAARFTGGDGEIALRDNILAALGEAGLSGKAAAHQCRAFVELVLGHIALTATLLSLPAEAQERDVLVGLRLYGRANAWLPRSRARAYADGARDDEDAVFRLMLAIYLAGVRASLRR